MNGLKTLLLAVSQLFVCLLIAQNSLPVPRNIVPAYQQGTRSADGKPGKSYWQNKADYSLAISFDPKSLLLQGVEDIAYVNNSPDTLGEIVFKLYPNLYRKGAQRLMNIAPEDVTDGLVIDKLEINKTIRTIKDPDGTNLLLDSIQLLPGKSLHFTIQYHYRLNKTSHIRTGEVEPGADFIAYFSPRIAVYDDMDGWNKNPYLGTQEFYNDFCNFRINITLPKNYIAWCTGNLVNGREVLTNKYYQRLQAAEKSAAVTSIIDSNDIKRHDITAGNSTNTWKYEASEVTDVAFAVSDHYAWNATSLIVDKRTGRRTRVDAVFNPKHADFFPVIDYARKTVEKMSFVFPKWPFPYPHETVFDGLDQMEYPMMVNDNPLQEKEETIELTDHEIFHTMFPFYMGINETKYGWMDEGWATIGEWLLSPMIDSTIADDYGVERYAKAAGSELDLPITTLTTQENGLPMFLNSYPKPAFGYLYVKDMLGDSLFTVALHYYISQWHGKHPIPYDFFNCMNAGAGKDLNWFWKRWFFDDGIPDLSIKEETKAIDNGKSFTYHFIIGNIGDKPVPVDVTAYFSDGITQTLHRTIEVWKDSNQLQLPVTSPKRISKVVLGSLYDVDSDKSNNTCVPAL